jgi:hypothetical protein
MGQGQVFEENMTHTPVCSVCMHELDDSIHRIVIFQDNEKNPIVKRFHFFFPCWDMSEICKNNKSHKIVNAGFSCEKTILNDPKQIKTLQKNFSLWE